MIDLTGETQSALFWIKAVAAVGAVGFAILVYTLRAVLQGPQKAGRG